MLMYYAVHLSRDKSTSVISIACGTLTTLFVGFLNLLPRYVFEIVRSACIYSCKHSGYNNNNNNNNNNYNNLEVYITNLANTFPTNKNKL